MNDLRLKPFDFQAAVARAGLQPNGMPRLDKVDATQPTQGASFKTAMADALQNVSAMQTDAEGLARQLTLGNPTVSIEETMVAMQKAQVGFQAAVQVRNRFAQAYSDIMNMQV